ncbi:hypothetical protein HKX48_007114 [Thoreauomyces humboldtii]|nr:hypothetical protein HKX48_007114 [Thoreauomyces humboldtii]
MCVTFFVLNHPRYKLIVCGNRDEYIDRTATRAHYWSDIGAASVLAGTDEGKLKLMDALGNRPASSSPDPSADAEYSKATVIDETPAPAAAASAVSAEAARSAAPSEERQTQLHAASVAVLDEPKIAEVTGHGSWMGINVSTGRFALLTNFREAPSLQNPSALTRGYLVRDFLLLSHDQTTEAYLSNVHFNQSKYNGFNFVAGRVSKEGAAGIYCGNRGTAKEKEPQHLRDGVVYGMSNGVLMEVESDWPKVERGKKLLQDALNKIGDQSSNRDEEAFLDKLLEILGDKTVYSAESLPRNMYSAELEMALCPICIDRERTPGAVYGTRLHTIMMVDHDGRGRFVEVNRYGAKGDDEKTDGVPGGRLDFRFVLGQPPSMSR